MGAMFGDLQALGRRQVEHLPGGETFAGRFAQGSAAAAARLGEMVDSGIGLLDLAQGFAGMPRLPAGLLARRRTQALDPARLPQPIAGWRLAAVVAVQAQTPLQLRDAGLQRDDEVLLLGVAGHQHGDNVRCRRDGAG